MLGPITTRIRDVRCYQISKGTERPIRNQICFNNRAQFQIVTLGNTALLSSKSRRVTSVRSQTNTISTIYCSQVWTKFQTKIQSHAQIWVKHRVTLRSSEVRSLHWTPVSNSHFMRIPREDSKSSNNQTLQRELLTNKLWHGPLNARLNHKFLQQHNICAYLLRCIDLPLTITDPKPMTKLSRSGASTKITRRKAAPHTQHNQRKNLHDQPTFIHIINNPAHNAMLQTKSLYTAGKKYATPEYRPRQNRASHTILKKPLQTPAQLQQRILQKIDKRRPKSPPPPVSPPLRDFSKTRKNRRLCLKDEQVKSHSLAEQRNNELSLSHTHTRKSPNATGSFSVEGTTKCGPGHRASMGWEHPCRSEDSARPVGNMMTWHP